MIFRSQTMEGAPLFHHDRLDGINHDYDIPQIRLPFATTTCRRYTVNTGFMHIMPTPENLMLWRKLLALDLVEISRDQRNTNLLLGKRTKKGIRAFRSEFFQKVYVIPVEVRCLSTHCT